MTAVEAAVAVLVIALLLGLLIPSWLRSRSEARRAGCRDNLRQLALAAQGYMGDHGCLPGGSFDSAGRAHNFGVFVRLLPRLGEGPLYNAINMNLTHHDVENLTIGTVALGVLVCPDDPEATRPAPMHYSGQPNSPKALLPGIWCQHFGSYAGNAGTWDLDIDPGAREYPARVASMNGTIFGMSSVTPAEVTDGSGMTFLFAERAHTALGLSRVSSRLATWTGTALSEYHFWQSGETVDNLFETWGPPNQHKIDVGFPKFENMPFLAANAGSFHPGDGAHFAFCDGSVRFIKESVDSWRLSRKGIPTPIQYDEGTKSWSLIRGGKPGIYQALSTRAGGEDIAGRDY